MEQIPVNRFSPLHFFLGWPSVPFPRGPVDHSTALSFMDFCAFPFGWRTVAEGLDVRRALVARRANRRP